MKAAGASEFTSQVDYSVYTSDTEEESSADEEEDNELYEQMETMALRDEYRGGHMPSEEEYSSDGSIAENPSRKRRRRR